MTELRKLQLLEVNLLQKFQQICKENDLTYYFTGGGLIGALRHGGFIPWDDDMDVVMPRDDYDKFEEICAKGLDDGYSMVSNKTDKSWKFTYLTFVDEKSVVRTKMEYGEKNTHVWVDVFPVDGMPNGKFMMKFHIWNVLFLRFLIQLAHIETMVGPKHRPLHERAILGFFRVVPVFKLVDSDKIFRRLVKACKKYKFGSSEYCCNLVGKYRSREIQPKERWGKPAKLLFEGIEVDVPEKYHEFQTHMYGDYMNLPPESERKAHDSSLVRHRNIDFDGFEKRSLLSRKHTLD